MQISAGETTKNDIFYHQHSLYSIIPFYLLYIFLYSAGSCEIFAEGNLLGAPACSKVQSIYLKVVYACINKEVLKSDYKEEIDQTSEGAESHDSSLREEAKFSDTDIGDSEDKESTEHTKTNGKEVSIVKEKDQSKLKQQGDVAVRSASDILSSYKHITDNTKEFLLFVGLAIALGIAIFLALVVWGMYCSNRLTRIKNVLRKPNRKIMTKSDTNTGNGTTSDIIDANVNSLITGNEN